MEKEKTKRVVFTNACKKLSKLTKIYVNPGQCLGWIDGWEPDPADGPMC